MERVREREREGDKIRLALGQYNDAECAIDTHAR